MTKPYFIKLAPTAIRQLDTLAPKSQKTIIQFLDALAINPRPPGAQKIDGLNGLYSEVVNPLRLIYKIEDQEILILLIK